MNSVEYHYQMLGLEPGASGAEIKQAYRDLVIVWHPDRFPGNSRLQKIATEKLKEFNLAYQELMEFVENSWYENLFGFEEEEFTREAEHAEDVQAHPENSDQGPEAPEKEETRMKIITVRMPNSIQKMLKHTTGLKKAENLHTKLMMLRIPEFILKKLKRETGSTKVMSR